MIKLLSISKSLLVLTLLLTPASAIKGRRRLQSDKEVGENATFINDENQNMVDTLAFGMQAYLDVADTLPKRYFVKTKGKKSKVLRDTKLSRGKVHHKFDELEIVVVSFENATDVSDFESLGYDESQMELDHPRFIAGLRGSASENRNLQSQQMPTGLKMVFQNNFPSTYPTLVYKQLCIIDSGFDSSHPDLAGIGVTSGDGRSTEYDGCSHGTHVAGTIVAKNNGFGSLGIYPGAPVTVVKVFSGSNCGYSYSSSMVAAANACYNKGARVINISAGGTGYSSTEEAAYNNLRQNGALVFAAAGNNGNSQLFYPAAYSSVISVAATDLNYNRASFSNYNNQVDISAPGVGIYSTIHGGYASWAGTSMACPHAAGVAYRLWNEFPGCSSNQVLTAMTSTASDLGSSGKDVYTGNGFIRFWKARDYLISQNC